MSKRQPICWSLVSEMGIVWVWFGFEAAPPIYRKWSAHYQNYSELVFCLHSSSISQMIYSLHLRQSTPRFLYIFILADLFVSPAIENLMGVDDVLMRSAEY